jgi:hypothetical protein
MAITPTSGSIDHTDLDGGSSALLPRYFRITHVAATQPAIYRIGNNAIRQGYRPTYGNLLQYIGTAETDIIIQGTNHTYYSTNSENTNIVFDISSGELEQYQTGGEFSQSYTTESPNVFTDELTFDVPSVGGVGEGAYHLILKTENDCDTAEASTAQDYEVFACHSNPETANDWVPFGTGEACSTYEMASLTSHNHNAVNYRTRHNQNVITEFAYLAGVA